MGTSATRAKRKYNSKTYERLEITVKATGTAKIQLALTGGTTVDLIVTVE